MSTTVFILAGVAGDEDREAVGDGHGLFRMGAANLVHAGSEFIVGETLQQGHVAGTDPAQVAGNRQSHEDGHGMCLHGAGQAR